MEKTSNRHREMLDETANAEDDEPWGRISIGEFVRRRQAAQRAVAAAWLTRQEGDLDLHRAIAAAWLENMDANLELEVQMIERDLCGEVQH